MCDVIVNGRQYDVVGGFSLFLKHLFVITLKIVNRNHQEVAVLLIEENIFFLEIHLEVIVELIFKARSIRFEHEEFLIMQLLLEDGQN